MALYGIDRDKWRLTKHTKTFPPAAVLHKTVDSTIHNGGFGYGGTYGYRQVSKACTGRGAVTTGRWSFRAPKTWTPDKPLSDADATLQFLSTGKTIPAWAYEIKPCSRCFPELMMDHTCSCGNNHKARKGDNGKPMVG